MNVPRRLWVALLCLFISSMTGCGLIYTHVTVPLDTNLTGQVIDTPGNDVLHGRNSSKHVTINSMNVDWGNRGIGHIAQDYGLTRVYYADLELLSILGIWRQQWVHIYGE